MSQAQVDAELAEFKLDQGIVVSWLMVPGAFIGPKWWRAGCAASTSGSSLSLSCLGISSLVGKSAHPNTCSLNRSAHSGVLVHSANVCTRSLLPTPCGLVAMI